MNYPTPPRPAQEDKENLPPTPVTPTSSARRTPRIVWSQENLHHAYSTQFRQLPSSSCVKDPQKSILKKPSRPLMPLMLPEEPVREVTPEPTDPLQHPLYLNSPVSTLLASLQPGSDAKISLIDLTEAYSVLSARLKTKMQGLFEACGPIPALEPLSEHSSELVEAICRDIRRAFVNPQSSPPPFREGEDLLWSSPSSVGSVKKRGYTEREVKYARDLCNLCHAALRCFSNISLAPALSSMFSDSQLGVILTELLAIPLAPSLPTPNARKTCQIAIWILQTQGLPIAVLEPARDRIVYALRRGIDGELGREGKKGSVFDALKAVSVLGSNQPAVFLAPLADIIPSVFNHLTSQNLALRLQAGQAVLSLSHALAHAESPSPVLVESYKQAISTYLTGQQNMRKSPQDLSPLGKEFRLCFENDTPVHPAQSPMWALSLIAAFIVLSESSAFTQPKTVKFLLGHLRTAMGVKRTTVRATAGLVWRALVWTCVKLDDSEQSQVHRDTGWKVVRQILDGAIGISVIAALVGQKEKSENRVAEALEAVRAMIKKGGRTCEEGVDILERLLSTVGSGINETRRDVWTNQKLLVDPLFDGTLLHAEWKGLVPHVKNALNQCATVQDVTPLQEVEVVQHWDALFTIWKDAVERAPLGEDGEAPPALLSAWQALLLTQAQLTQGFEHLTSAPVFITYLTDLLKSFLNDSSLEWSLEADAPSWSSQSLKLGFVRNLWTVVRRVFAVSTLAGAAQSLLYEVLRNDYLLDQVKVRDTWSALCAELVLAGLPELARDLWKSQDQEQDLRLESEVKRSLWRVVGERWIREGGPWHGAIELIRAPFASPDHWTFNDEDFELWVRLVDCAFHSASPREGSTVAVLDAIASEMGTCHGHISFHAALPHLLVRIETSSGQQCPRILLKLINDVLLASYPPSDPEDRHIFLAILDRLKEIVVVTCQELIVEFLAHIQHGVAVWIADMDGVFIEREYNEQVVPFYSVSLEVLKTLPASVDLLHSLCPLLVSAFGRIPEPALGPSAFKGFWSDVYRRHINLSDVPRDLRPVIGAVYDAMCEETNPSSGPNAKMMESISTFPDSHELISSWDHELSSREQIEELQRSDQNSLEPRETSRHDSRSEVPSMSESLMDDARSSPQKVDNNVVPASFSSTTSRRTNSRHSSRRPRFSQSEKKRKTAPEADVDVISINGDEESIVARRSNSTRLSTQSTKKRKTASGEATVDFMIVGDDENSGRAPLNLSIVAKRRKSTRLSTQRTRHQKLVPKEEFPSHTIPPERNNKKRKLFEAVELPTLREILKRRRNARYHL